MNDNTRRMLMALQFTHNPMTRAHAVLCLMGAMGQSAQGPRPARELATLGLYGGFLQTVMTGDIEASRAKADTINLEALDRMK
jgi:hypothetical protein